MGGLVLGLALVAFAIVLDVGLLVRAYERSASSTLTALLVAAAAAAVTVIALVLSRRARTHRRVLGWLGIAWAVTFVVAVLWTHPRHRDELLTPLEAGVTAYAVLIVTGALGFLPIVAIRLGRPRPRQRA
jgi:drug/metabolite transporter (DMT)-like permease